MMVTMACNAASSKDDGGDGDGADAYADHDDDNDDDIVTRAVGQEKERRPVFISKRLPGASTLPRRGR